MNEEYYIDCDGVIIDSQDIINDIFAYYNCDSSDPYWNYILEIIDWNWLLTQCNEINGSFEVLRELQRQGRKVYILSRVFSIEEALAKQAYLNSKGIYFKVIPVMKRINKSEVVKPEPYKILVDDSLGNVLDWRRNGGTAIYFPEEEQDLKFLVKKKVL